MWFFHGFGIRPGRKVMWSKVLQVLQTRGSMYLWMMKSVYKWICLIVGFLFSDTSDG